MLQPGSQAESTIGQLRIVADQVDPLAAQLRLASLLGETQLHPGRLPPSALVVIRHLRDPMPRALRLDYGGGHLPMAWARAVNESIDRLTFSASRPVVEPVPSDAQAIVFLDQSELLATLASDWCEGRITTHWWWRTLLRNADARQVVWKAWHDSPEYIPAALQHLAKSQNVTRFVETFSDAEIRPLLHVMARSFGLHALLSTLELHDAGPTSSDASGPANIGLPRAKRRSEAHSAGGAALPFRQWVPETESTNLGPEQQCFLGIALMLQRAPAKVRSSSFAADVARWQREVALQGHVDSEPYSQGEPHRNDQRRSSPRVRALDELASSPARLHPQQQAAGFVREPVPTGDRSNDTAQADTSDALTTFSKQRSGSAPHASESALAFSGNPRPAKELETSKRFGSTARTEERDIGSDQSVTRTVEGTAANVESFEIAVIGEQTDTEFAGLFYLINLGIYLGLYNDFTTPDEPGLELNLWDFVALVGQELIGTAVQDDPIWSLLALLAQREEGDVPGSGFEPEDEWRLPPEWLQPFSKEKSGRWRWCASSTHLRLFHPAGFLVLDILRDAPQKSSRKAASPVAQLRRELKAYETFEFRVSSFELIEEPALENELETRNSKLETHNSKLETWVNRLLPYVRARLRKALGLTPHTDPGPFICRHQARICVTPTHVDLFFRLAELPLEIRFAGLDRDPGWVPAAGRFIAFHFE